MARPPSPLPLMPCGLDGLLREPSVFSTVAARRAGVPAHRLRRADLVSEGRGLWRRRDREPELLDRLRALQDIHPTAAFSHTTALRVLGVKLPARWDTDEAVHLTLPASAPVAARRSGVRVHRRAGERVTLEVEGVRVVDGPSAVLDLAAAGASLEDLVVVGDGMLLDERDRGRRRRQRQPVGAVRREELVARVAAQRGARGVVRARQAAELVRPGSDSPQETRLRLLVHEAGLTEPEVNPAVRLETGQRLRVDLVWAQERVAVEYDGDHHRTDQRQWREDRERDAGLRAEGWTVIRVTADVFREPHRELFLRQLRIALALPPR
ncbi:DUF559 domain-containing protein [Micrococcus sp.]|uniref:DUF559 domain-containing protein n=1 Tax=Micrococcus sp. TaxID=1271 RepID=UPI002A91F5E8|nr:DUF559 domain-containing protein [Micrococcus sp.]MDY6054959.1 DUF559 domain-containing protein [Micrococcus sp.]